MTSASASTSSGSKHRISDQQDPSATLTTQNEAKKLKINRSSAFLRISSTGSAAAASSSTTLITTSAASAAQAVFKSSASASSSGSTILSLSNLNGQIEYLGPDSFTVIFSYLHLSEITDLSKQIFSVYSEPNRFAQEII